MGIVFREGGALVVLEAVGPVLDVVAPAAIAASALLETVLER